MVHRVRNQKDGGGGKGKGRMNFLLNICYEAGTVLVTFTSVNLMSQSCEMSLVAFPNT